MIVPQPGCSIAFEKVLTLSFLLRTGNFPSSDSYKNEECAVHLADLPLVCKDYWLKSILLCVWLCCLHFYEITTVDYIGNDYL